jgi:TRAP-type C4-dicarboxylate transport system permease small subunit
MKYVQWISKVLQKLGGLSLLGMMLLTVADVIGSIFGHPILGAEEIVALWASILLAFSLPAAHINGAHVGVELLYTKFPLRVKKINNFIIALVSFVLFSLTTWQCYLYADYLRSSGEVTMTLQLPAWVLIFCVSFALMILSIAIFFDLFNPGGRTDV